MSLGELTRNSFQSGIPPKKWVNLCKLFLSSDHIHTTIHDAQVDVSNSVLILFRNYPGEPALQGYLRHAIQDGLISLPTYMSTFLSIARSPELQNSATLDMLCRVALDSHYASGLPAIGSLVSYSESTIDLLGTVQNAMALLRTAYTLPASQFHQLTTSASELLVLLLSCITDVSQISTAQALVHFADATDMLQVLRLSPAVRQELETFALSLNLLLGDDAKAAREAQMMHTLQLALGKGDVFGSGSDTDIVSCGLVHYHLVFNRAHDYGAGDGLHAVSVLVGMFRWTSWSPIIFCTQLILSALTCATQSTSTSPSPAVAIRWKAYVLPSLLRMSIAAAVSEGAAETDWQIALQGALAAVMQHADLLNRCELMQSLASMQTTTMVEGSPGKQPTQSSFVLELLYNLVSVGLLDASYATTLKPALLNDYHPRLQTEVQDAGVDLSSYFELKLSADVNIDDAVTMVEKICREANCHNAFAEVVQKRFSSLTHSLDVESMSHLCRILCRCEPALDILSLYISLPNLVAHALAFIEDYDCETVGDPQTAVSHFGDIVLFLQELIARFNLSLTYPHFSLGERRLTLEVIRSAAVIHPTRQLQGEDAAALHVWIKALFDSSSEGIEDTILRNTPPKTLLRLASTLLAYAIGQFFERKIDKEILLNGVSYFLGPLLNWTLPGVIKTLLTDIKARNFNAPVHLEILHTIITSSACPKVVVRLSASNILRIVPSVPKPENRQNTLDPEVVRRAVLQILGLSREESPLSLGVSSSNAINQPAQSVREVLEAARAGKAPSLDVERCLLVVPPSQFLQILWRELIAAAALGEMDIPRRLATFVLTTPRLPYSPPLLPMFLHNLLPGLLVAADSLSPSDQTITVELLVAVITSALTAALYLEWALLTTCQEQRLVLGQSAAAMARRLGNDLRSKGAGAVSGIIVQRLIALPTFTTNFPTFMADL